MRRVLLVFLVACGHHPNASPPPPPPPAPDAAPIASTTCDADETHCCMPDGTVVDPGGCQPHYQEGKQPNVVRDDDGTCKPVPCTLKCLPEDTMIATPDGDVAITALHTGDAVWTAAADGTRVAATIEQVSSMPRTETHLLVELTLADGRVLRASAGHPDANGEQVVDLAVGDALDGTTIAKVRYVDYDGAATWDLLPSGATGTYWANGVLVGSTLQKQQGPTPPPAPITIDGDIIVIAHDHGKVRVTMNRGTADGVQVNWHASVLDRKGNSIANGSFVIDVANKHSSIGDSNLPMSTLKNSTMHVRLTP